MMMEKLFSIGSAPRLYNEDPRSAEIIIEEVTLRRQLKMTEKRWQREQFRLESQPVKRRLSVRFEDFMCAVITVRLL
jgi:hypothetical protein